MRKHWNRTNSPLRGDETDTVRINDTCLGAHGMENHHICSSGNVGKSSPEMETRSTQRGAVLPMTGGCLNLSVIVLRMERETRSCLPSITKEG